MEVSHVSIEITLLCASELRHTSGAGKCWKIGLITEKE